MSMELLILFAAAMVAAIIGFGEVAVGVAWVAKLACGVLLVLFVALTRVRGIRKPVV